MAASELSGASVWDGGQRQGFRGALHTTPRRLDVALSRRHDQESSEASAREGTSNSLC